MILRLRGVDHTISFATISDLCLWVKYYGYKLSELIFNISSDKETSIVKETFFFIHNDLVVSEQRVKTGWCEDHQCDHHELRVLAHLCSRRQDLSTNIWQTQPGHNQTTTIHQLEVSCSWSEGIFAKLSLYIKRGCSFVCPPLTPKSVIFAQFCSLFYVTINIQWYFAL